MVADLATTHINRTAGIVMKTFFRNGKEKMKQVKEDVSRKVTQKRKTHFSVKINPCIFISRRHCHSYRKHVGA